MSMRCSARRQPTLRRLLQQRHDLCATTTSAASGTREDVRIELPMQILRDLDVDGTSRSRT